MGLFHEHGKVVVKEHHGRSHLPICYEVQLTICPKDNRNAN